MPDSPNKDSNDIRQSVDDVHGGTVIGQQINQSSTNIGVIVALIIAVSLIIAAFIVIIPPLLPYIVPPTSTPAPTSTPTIVISDTPIVPTETPSPTYTETTAFTNTPTATNTPPKPLTPTSASSGTATIPVPSITEITSPANRSLVGYQSTVIGNYDPSQLQDNTLWIFIKSLEEKRFYPQVIDRCSPDISTAVKPDPSNGTWSADIFIGTIGDADISKDFEIYLLVADPGENSEILGMFNGRCTEENFPEIRSYEQHGLSQLGRRITVERE